MCELFVEWYYLVGLVLMCVFYGELLKCGVYVYGCYNVVIVMLLFVILCMELDEGFDVFDVVLMVLEVV